MSYKQLYTGIQQNYFYWGRCSDSLSRPSHDRIKQSILDLIKYRSIYNVQTEQVEERLKTFLL